MRTLIAVTLLNLMAASSSAQPLPDKIPDRHPAMIGEPTPKMVRTVPITPAHTFEERWEPVHELLAQQERRKAMNFPSPRVANDAVAAALADAKAANQASGEKNAPAATPPRMAALPRARKLGEDTRPAQVLCIKNNMRTVWQGSSWRCRK